MRGENAGHAADPGRHAPDGARLGRVGVNQIRLNPTDQARNGGQRAHIMVWRDWLYQMGKHVDGNAECARRVWQVSRLARGKFQVVAVLEP